MFSSYPSTRVGTKSFSLVQDAFLQARDLPFRDVLSEEEIREAFAAENACFAEDEADIYTPPLTLWAWLSQVMHAGKARSCVATVARITALCVVLGRKPPSPDTGTCCHRNGWTKKLMPRFPRRLACVSYGCVWTCVVSVCGS